MSDPKLQQRIETDLGPRTTALEKQNEAQKGPMEQVASKLVQAMRNIDAATVKALTKQLEAQVAAYSGLVVQANRLNDELSKIKSDDAEAMKQIQALHARSWEAQRKALANYTKLKELLDKANDAPAATDAMLELAGLEDWMKKHMEATRLRVRQMDTLVELAESAVKDGDAESLAQAKAKAELRPKWGQPHVEALERQQRVLNREVPSLSSDLQDQRKRDLKRFVAQRAELAEMSDKLDAAYKTIKGMQLRPQPAKAASLDFRKAAALLAVAEPKLKKAWDGGGAAPEKALDALAKELKLKTTGKDMVAALRKAKLLA